MGYFAASGSSGRRLRVGPGLRVFGPGRVSENRGPPK